MPHDMILFHSNAVPAHIANNPPPISLNANAQQGIRLTFPVVSIEGRIWSVTHRGVETTITASEGTDHNGRPLPAAPVRALKVIIVGISPTISKAYYAKSFQPGSRNVLPDCFSTNGEVPDITSPMMQSETCALCEKNKFESAISDDGTKGRGKACRDGRKIAVVPDGDVRNAMFGGPMMLRLPVMSMPNLAKYCGQLSIAGYDVSQVVTAMSFNPDVRYPEVVFSAVSFIQAQEDYEIACDWMRSDTVRQMLDEAPTFENTSVSPVEPTREQFRETAPQVDEVADFINRGEPTQVVAPVSEPASQPRRRGRPPARQADPVPQSQPDPEPPAAVATPAFEAWLVDGEGIEIPDEAGRIEAFTDPVAFARAYRVVEDAEPVGTLELLRRANQESVDVAGEASAEAAAILNGAQDAARNAPPANGTLFADLPLPDAFIAGPLSPTMASFTAYNEALAEMLARHATPQWVNHVRDVNLPTVNTFPPARKNAAKAIIDAREKELAAPAHPTQPQNNDDLAQSLIADVQSLDTAAEVRTWQTYAPVVRDLEKLKTERIGLHANVVASANNRWAELRSAEMVTRLNDCASLADLAEMGRDAASLADLKEIAAVNVRLFEKVRAIGDAKRVELTP
jgi:hypothetical protein